MAGGLWLLAAAGAVRGARGLSPGVDDGTLRRRVADARVARLATVRPNGRPHVVVCCYSLVGDVVYSPVDDKPKATTTLQRLRNLAVNPAASLLVDHYEESWASLWWVRLDGFGRVISAGAEHEQAWARLAGKYEQYQAMTRSGRVIALDVTRWSGWSAS